MKRILLAVAATAAVFVAVLITVVEPQVVEAIAVIDTNGHIMAIVLVNSDGSTVRYDPSRRRDPNEAIAIGNGLDPDDRYVIVVPCPDDIGRGVGVQI